MKKLTSAVLMVGSPQNTPDIQYATGFTAPDPVVYLQKGKKKFLVVSLLELERARRVMPGVVVQAAETLKMRPEWKKTLSGWTLGLLRQAGINAVVVPPDFPIAVAEKLKQFGIRIRIAEHPLFPQRQIKTGEELVHIAESQKAAVQAMTAAVRHLALARVDGKGFLRVGKKQVTSESVRAIINKVLLDCQCTGQGTIVAGGDQASDPHETGFGPLRRGENIVIDIFPRHLEHGYWGDLTRTVVKGPPSPALLKMYRAVKAAHAAALSVVRAGVAASQVHKAAVHMINRRGFKNKIVNGNPQGFIHSTGHGVGLTIHEMPRVGLQSVRLKKGNVITVEPGLYYRHLGSVRIEDTIVVTSFGWKPLAACNYFFQV